MGENDLFLMSLVYWLVHGASWLTCLFVILCRNPVAGKTGIPGRGGWGNYFFGRINRAHSRHFEPGTFMAGTACGLDGCDHNFDCASLERTNLQTIFLSYVGL